MAEAADVVIVGGGVTGLALAWELARRRRRRILVLEQRHSGYGASGRNIGRVRTSQFTRELARFAVAAQRKHARLSDELGVNTLFWRPGYALVFYEADELAAIESIAAMLREEGLRPELRDGRATVRRLPVLAGGVPPVGSLTQADAVAHHDSVLYGYRKAIAGLGVALREGCEVQEILVSGTAVQGVRVAAGEIRAPLVVNAAGGWAGRLSRLAGIAIPNTPIRREVIVTESHRPFMDTMISYYRPIEAWFHQTLRGELVAGTVSVDEPPGLDFSASDAALNRTAHAVLRVAPRLAGLRVVRQWAGTYDVTPDRKPLVGPVRQLEGFVQANGYSGRGFALIPFIAELLAAWLDTGERPPLLAPFDPDRYVGREETPVVVGDYYAGY
jgi:sarcosine oxidase subunit beta